MVGSRWRLAAVRSVNRQFVVRAAPLRRRPAASYLVRNTDRVENVGGVRFAVLAHAPFLFAGEKFHHASPPLIWVAAAGATLPLGEPPRLRTRGPCHSPVFC
jgi:hypothetical protein